MTSQLRGHGSIRRRLTLQLLVSAAILAGMVFGVLQNHARQLAQTSQDTILAASVTSILDAITVQGGELEIDLPYSALSMLGNVSDDRVFYRVMAAGDVVTGYPDLPPVRSANLLQRDALTAEYAGGSIRMVSSGRRLSVEGHPVDVIVSVAQTRDGQANALRQITRRAILFGIGFFAVAAALGVLAAQSTVRPLKALTASISRRGPQDLRPVQTDVPTEMVPLVRSFNRFIARLHVTLTRSEDFIAEAAHRVRTPLATVRAQAEMARLRVEKPETKAALGKMIDAIDESSRAAGQLLDHAMVTFRSDQMERQPMDLRDAVRDTVKRLAPIAGLKDIAITITAAGPVVVLGDAILLQNAIGNILDNAIKYSPEDSDISIELRLTDGTGQVSICDQGPGIPRGMARQLTRRFERGPNASGTIGSGLGLTIAEEVVSSHGGQMYIDTSSEGSGTCVTLAFPLS